ARRPAPEAPDGRGVDARGDGELRLPRHRQRRSGDPGRAVQGQHGSALLSVGGLREGRSPPATAPGSAANGSKENAEASRRRLALSDDIDVGERQASAKIHRCSPLLPNLSRVSLELLDEYARDTMHRAPPPDGAFTGAAGGAACGDLVRVSILLDAGAVARVTFDAEGCAPARAAGAALARRVGR